VKEAYFATALALQRHEANCIAAYRREKAERLRHIADTYAMEALNCTDTSERAWHEGMSEGLRTAAAELDVAQVTA